MRSRLPATRLALAAAPFVLFPLTTADAQSDRRTLSGSEISIYNIAGHVTVESGSGSDVIVEVTRRGRDADRLRIATGDIRGRNTLRVIYPDDDIVYLDRDRRDRDDRGDRTDRNDRSVLRRWSGRSNSEFTVYDDGTWGGNNNDRYRGRRVRVSTDGRGTEAWADIRVTVPAGKRVDVNLGVGDLDADRVNADLTLDVHAANVTATGVRGSLNVDAGSGSVEVRDADTETLDIDTGSGSVRLTGVRSSRCNVDTGSGGVTGQRVNCDQLSIDVGSGSVRFDDVRAARASVDAGSGGVTLDLRESPRDLDVESGSGTVTIGLPDNIGADVDIRTGSGGISTDFPLQTNRYDRNSLRGRIGNGSGRIRIESGSGGVRLRRL